MISTYEMTWIEWLAWIDTYTRLTNRWMHIEPVKAMPVMGVRLLAIRARAGAGMEFDEFLKAVTVNQAEVELMVHKEYEVRHCILSDLVARNASLLPPKDLEAVGGGLAEELEAALSIEGRFRLTMFLQRLVRRYWRFEE
jgi:hypothetical protein